MKKKSKIITGAIITICLMATGFGIVKATSGSNNPMSGLITTIAQKFNLNESDVQTVFDGYKTQMNTEREARRTETQAQRQQEFTTRINQAVTDGKLTQTQANAILAKMTELQTQKEELENKTPEERRTIMKERMDTLKQWMTDNNIPQQYCPFMGFGMGKGMGGFEGRGHGMFNNSN